MRAREGLPAGLCVVRVTRLSREEVLITVTTKLDVGRPDGRTFRQVTDTAKAIELVREFLEQWQSVQDW